VTPATSPFAERSAPEPVLRGVLQLGARPLAATLAAASRTSLRVAFDDVPPAAETVFESLTVNVEGGLQQLSRCRFDPAPGEGFHGTLVFLDEVYDARALVFEGHVVSRRRGIESIPIILSQRDRIRPEFRDYVADALYDLSAWRKFFDDEDSVLEGEPPRAVAAGRAAILNMHAETFFRFFDGQLEQLKQIVKGFTKEEHERHGFYFRRQAWPYILASEFMRRTNFRPYGYAGDAEMMRIIYEQSWAGATTFEQLMHKHAVDIPAAQAVRNRRVLVTEELLRVSARYGPHVPGGLRFLSVAAGPAWELRDLYRTPEDAERLHCSLLDHDHHALTAARDVVTRLEAERGFRLDVSWFRDSVRTMLRPLAAERYGRQHFVYSMGLFDYLATPVARAVLSRMYDLLLPGGTLMVGNYHVANPNRFYMEYWGDWKLIYRDEAHLLALAEGLAGARCTIGFDTTGCQMFLRIVKEGDGP
jgi:extracellular factor (EF) 3-hydroxypalmitic acid methyl ester biosynthesis protein